MDRLSGLDASFLYLETASQPLHVCALLLLDDTTVPGGYDSERFRDDLARRSGEIDAFRRKLFDLPLNLGHPFWTTGSDVDGDRHVHRVGLPAPGDGAELAELCAHIAGQPLDRNRPLWEMWVIEGLADGGIAVCVKMHHSATDGVTGANLLAHLCSFEPDAVPGGSGADGRVSAAAEEQRAPGALASLADGVVRLARGPAELLRLLPRTAALVPDWIARSLRGHGMPAPFTAPRTSFNATITGRRSMSFVSLPLADVKSVKRVFGTTVNDVVLAVCASALRRYLDDRGELPDRSLVAMVPVSTRGRGIERGTNQVTGLFTALHTHVADPVRRLMVIAESNVDSKSHHGSIDSDMLHNWAQFAAPHVFGLAARLYAALRLAERHPVVYNLLVSNVAGPRQPLYFLGALVRGMYPLGPVFHGAGLNITVMSNADRVDVGLLAARELAPDVDLLASHFHDGLAELLAAVPTAEQD